VTATDYANFFALRDHPDAQPEIQELARLMKKAYQDSIPNPVHLGEWHLPYITDEDWKAAYWKCKEGRITRDEPRYEEKLEIVRKISVARCARVSYKAFDGNVAPIEKDLELFEQLLVSQPLHASPAEHQATPDTYVYPDWDREQKCSDDEMVWSEPELHANFRGWMQYRKLLPNEYVAG
jgi:thymidylate synthase ThyX